MDVLARANFRKKRFELWLLKFNGLNSGEYEKTHITLAPTDLIICTIDSSLFAGKLSITTTAIAHN